MGRTPVSKRRVSVAGRPPRDAAATGLQLADLVTDPENRRVHNARNMEMVRESLTQVGAARSIVIDEDNVILAGNGVTAAAAEAGITKLRVIDAAGDELIAVRRSGLTAAQKRALAIFDNRASELATWDVAQLSADAAADLPLDDFWTADELAKLLGLEAEGADDGPMLDQAIQLKPAREYIVVMCADGEAGAVEFEQLKAALDLQAVRRGGYKRGSEFDDVGTQRVVTAADLLARLPRPVPE